MTPVTVQCSWMGHYGITVPLPAKIRVYKKRWEVFEEDSMEADSLSSYHIPVLYKYGQ